MPKILNVENASGRDKAEVYQTDILRKYPFPEFKGEKDFSSECAVWDKISLEGYWLRWYPMHCLSLSTGRMEAQKR